MRATANICTAGLNLVELNLAPLNSSLLRQGQDEATRFQLYWSKYSFSFFCSATPSYVLRQPRHELCNRTRLWSAKTVTEPFSPHSPAQPKSPGPHKQQSQEQALGVWTPSLLYWTKMPIVYLAHAAYAVALDDYADWEVL